MQTHVGLLLRIVVAHAYICESCVAIEQARRVDKRRATAQGKDATVAEPPLLGLPISIKDLFNMKGYDSTCGCEAYVCHPFEEDGGYIAMVREQGAIPFIRSNGK